MTVAEIAWACMNILNAQPKSGLMCYLVPQKLIKEMVDNRKTKGDKV